MDYQGDSGGGGNYGGGGSGFNGGGFNGGGSSGGGSEQRRGGGGGRRSYDEQTMIPVTARMLLGAQSSSNAEGTGHLALEDGRDLHYVKFIGAVRSVEDFSTNVTYTIEDGTGLIEVKQWIDDNDCNAVAEMRQECLKENIYVKVVGQLKDYDSKKNLVAHTVRRINDGNEITHHFLEVVYSAERYKRGSRIGGLPPAIANNGVGFGGGMPINQPMNSGSGDSLMQKVLDFIKVEGGTLEMTRVTGQPFADSLFGVVRSRWTWCTHPKVC